MKHHLTWEVIDMSLDYVFRYLAAFHDPAQEGLRQPIRAFIPALNEYLQGFGVTILMELSLQR